jgi:hypothetical protein
MLMAGTIAGARTARQIAIDIIGLVIFCAILNLLVDRSIAPGSIPLSTWVVLSVGDVVGIYPPFLLMTWALSKIWKSYGLRQAHQSAMVATLLLNVLARVLLAYSIGSGFSNP